METPRRDNKKQLKIKSEGGGMPTASELKTIEVRDIPGVGIRLVATYNNKLYYAILGELGSVTSFADADGTLADITAKFNLLLDRLGLGS